MSKLIDSRSETMQPNFQRRDSDHDFNMDRHECTHVFALPVAFNGLRQKIAIRVGGRFSDAYAVRALSLDLATGGTDADFSVHVKSLADMCDVLANAGQTRAQKVQVNWPFQKIKVFAVDGNTLSTGYLRSNAVAKSLQRLNTDWSAYNWRLDDVNWLCFDVDVSSSLTTPTAASPSAPLAMVNPFRDNGAFKTPSVPQTQTRDGHDGEAKIMHGGAWRAVKAPCFQQNQAVVLTQVNYRTMPRGKTKELRFMLQFNLEGVAGVFRQVQLSTCHSCSRKMARLIFPSWKDPSAARTSSPRKRCKSLRRQAADRQARDAQWGRQVDEEVAASIMDTTIFPGLDRINNDLASISTRLEALAAPDEEECLAHIEHY